MVCEDELGMMRRAHAKQIVAAAEATDERIRSTFAGVPKEAFPGPGP